MLKIGGFTIALDDCSAPPIVEMDVKVTHSQVATNQVPKWFKLAARLWAADVYWDPKEECICNKSNEMLNLAISNLGS